jgi:kynurenine formamidase
MRDNMAVRRMSRPDFHLIAGSTLVGLILALITTASARAQSTRKVAAADIESWMSELSNWGRWGKQDQLGTVNLITPAKRREAAKLIKDGISVSLARTVETEKADDNDSPFGHTMTATGRNALENTYSMDQISVSYHGWAHSHMDSLCHMFYKGKMFNGFSQDHVTSKGATKLAVINFKNGLLTRGILMDIPRLKGIPYLEPGTPIYPEDLDAWEKKAGLKVGAGDIVLIRTGRWALRDAKGAWPISKNAAGLYASCARWLKSRDVAVLGSDAASDVMPSGVSGVSQPIHQLAIIAMGMPIFDNLDLEALSAEANKRQRWEFHISAAPLAITGGTGSPFNPIATF